MKIYKIEILFPFRVDLPLGFDRALSESVNLICEHYEEQHPKRVMWPAGHGFKPLSSDFSKFDEAIYQISISERQAYPKEKKKK